MYAYIIFCIIISSCASTVELANLTFSESYTAQILQTVQNITGIYTINSTVYRDYYTNSELTLFNYNSSLQSTLIRDGCSWSYLTLSRNNCSLQSNMSTLEENFDYLDNLTLNSTINGIDTWTGSTLASNIFVTVNSSDRTTPLNISFMYSTYNTTNITYVSWTAGAPNSSEFDLPANCSMCGYTATSYTPTSSVSIPPTSSTVSGGTTSTSTPTPTSSTVSAEIASYTLLIVACLMMVLFIDKI